MTKFLKKKMRLDEYLCENEYFEDLEVAKKQIMAGNVIINEQKIDKPGIMISLDKIKTVRIKEKNISPLNILALTFTNKAAREMKERAEELIGEENSYNLVVSTFHSFAVRILKTYSERIGYGRNFNIYDVDDQKSIITKIKKEMNIKDDIAPGRIANRISKLKEDGVGLDEVSRQLDLKIPANRLFYDIYKKYDEVLKANNAMDFSDLLLNARRLLDDKYVLDIIQNRYQYIVVDEYQDTNNIQYEIINLIAAKYRNICVVGDEDQSIYAFRGANIENILNFEKDYPDAYTIKLERNYRSTKRILDTANELIRNNKSSKGKKLWTDGSEGEKIKIFNAKTPYDEAEFIVKEIKTKSKSGVDYKDMTILYRTNAQSRVLEEKLLEGNVPYKIYGGMQFFQRKEIKDILAYLNLLNNRNDNHNFYRIINVPKRSIGEKTLEKIAEIANERNIPMLDALQFVDETNIRGAVKNTLKDFYNMIQGIYLSLDELSVKEVFDEVITKTKYFDSIEDNKEDRVKNIEELLNSIIELEKRNPHVSLADYLDMVSLTASTDEMEENENFVKLMTIHSSKGLEFDYVFIAGMEDGLFPSCSFESSEEDIEEERRLCYVAVTRAKKELYISYASERMTWGQMNYNRKPSRFIYEMKQENLEYLVNNIITLSKTKKISSSSFREDKFQVKKENFNPFSIRKSKEIHETNSKYKVGDTVTHKKFGKGRIKHVDKKSLTIDFMVGEKKLALILAEKFLID